uniref:Uncharacterized protein n=1 Tax=Meloidogyne floridensis TaxID=298350 RepID=A0A915P7B7_9BILA
MSSFFYGIVAVFLLFFGNVRLEVVEDSTTTRTTATTVHQVKSATVGTGQLMSGQKV